MKKKVLAGLLKILDTSSNLIEFLVDKPIY